MKFRGKINILNISLGPVFPSVEKQLFNHKKQNVYTIKKTIFADFLILKNIKISDFKSFTSFFLSMTPKKIKH